MSGKRSFLFLQGPDTPFFRELGLALHTAGCTVCKISMCGGDVVFWARPFTRRWHGSRYEWPAWISARMEEQRVTDMVLMGDWRPLHREAVLLARVRGVRIWVFEEGYLRPGFLTLEEGGVNASSPLPRTPQGVRDAVRVLGDMPVPEASTAPNPLPSRVWQTIFFHVGNFFLWPLFPGFQTHRPYCIGRELMGWLPRYLSRKRRQLDSQNTLRAFFRQGSPYYFFPMQLDADSQIRRHSPFNGVLESLAAVVTSFVSYAPPDSYLLIKNHPLDNGLINYRRYMRAMGNAAGCANRIRFLEGVSTARLIRRCRAVVVCNSTVGLTALAAGKPVYCLGDAIYAMPGLAVTPADMPLSQFWSAPAAPDAALLGDFLRLLKCRALVPGNFYSPQGIADAVAASMSRLGEG